MIRSILRQGRIAGVDADTLISIANVSVHSGLNVVFSKEKSFVAANGTYADGAIDLRNNRIIINPEAKTRTHEMILIHELTHAIYNLKNGTLKIAEGVKSMTAEEQENIRKRYSKAGQTNPVLIVDEMNAHFAEQTLSNKNILERLVADKPSVKEKIINFFKGAKSDYDGDVKLTKAAEKLYKQYRKLFNDFSKQNYQNNAEDNTAAVKLDEKGKVKQTALTQSEKAKAARDAKKTKAKTETESRYAIKKSTDGDMFVEVEKQTVNAEMTPEEIADTLTDIVNNKYTSFVDVHGQKIGINQRTKNEWLKSKSAQALLRTDNQAYLDKVNAFNNADELLNSSKEYVGEKKNHSRKDNFVEFARGIVDFKVGNNGYEADIIVGTTKNGVAILYDIVNLQHKK